jgi:hypothetical protein
VGAKRDGAVFGLAGSAPEQRTGADDAGAAHRPDSASMEA